MNHDTMIDDNLLLQCFEGTLSSNLAIRTSSETKLNELAQVPGFLIGCLQLIDKHQTLDGKLATAVYFKNQILLNWNLSPDDINDDDHHYRVVADQTLGHNGGVYDNSNGDSSGKQRIISSDEKSYIKHHLIMVMSKSEYNIKQQLLPVIRVLLTYEYPNNWPNFLSIIGELLNHQPNNHDDEQFNSIYTALLIMGELFRKYRWFKNEDRSHIIDDVFIQLSPLLISISNYLIEHSSHLTEFKSEILKLILKIFKFITYYDLPKFLNNQPLIESWCQLHYNIINMPLPAYIDNINDEHDKNFLQISKVLKWSLANLNRLFKRYIINKKSKEHLKFKKIFNDSFLPYLINNLIKIIEMWCLKLKWINLSSLYYIIEILENSINIKNLWLIIKPIYLEIIVNFIYPLIVPNDHKVEIFNNDPQEYIQLTFNYFNTDCNNPDLAAINLLNTLIEKRKKTCFKPIIKFIYTKLIELNNQKENSIIAQQKEGILRMIGSIINPLINSNESLENLEPFLINQILPNLESKFKFLVARTFEILSKFSDLNFKNQDNLNLIIYNVLKNFNYQNYQNSPESQSNKDEEDNLVIILENSLAIQSYLHLPEFKEHLSTMILPVMSKLLEISNKIDNDTISVVMQECVENFGEQLQPFGIELVHKLVENFMELVSEIDDEQQKSGGMGELKQESNNDNDKIITAIGNLNTIITVLLTFENNQEIIDQLTEILTPMIKFILINENENFFSEISEIIENLIYLNKSSSQLVDILQLILINFEHEVGINYLEEFLPCLKNFLIYSNFEINHDNHLIEKFGDCYLKIFSIIINQCEQNLNDLTLTFELMQYFILNFKLKSIGFFKDLGTEIFKVYQLYDMSNLNFKTNFNNVIVSMIIYDSNAIIRILNENFNNFLIQWFNIIPNLSRVFDIKLSILGLISLINNNNILNNLNLSNNLLLLIRKLPNAINELNKRRQLFNSFDVDLTNHYSNNDNQAYSFEDEDEEEEDDEHEEHEVQGDGHDQVQVDEGEHGDELDDDNDDQDEYLKFLNQENLKLSNFDDELNEDPLEVTPLDNINLKEILTNFVSLLTSKNPDKFNFLFGNLPDNELNNCINLI